MSDKDRRPPAELAADVQKPCGETRILTVTAEGDIRVGQTHVGLKTGAR